MLLTVPSSEGRKNFPEVVPVIAEMPLALLSSEGCGKLGTTGTTVWFTVGYCQLLMYVTLLVVGNSLKACQDLINPYTVMVCLLDEEYNIDSVYGYMYVI